MISPNLFNLFFISVRNSVGVGPDDDDDDDEVYLHGLSGALVFCLLHQTHSSHYLIMRL